jgi:hypothetical protein
VEEMDARLKDQDTILEPISRKSLDRVLRDIHG